MDINMFGCLFGHNFALKQIGDAYVNECTRCKKTVVLSKCSVIGHKWQGTGHLYKYRSYNGFDDRQWTTETQVCPLCMNTREMKI